MELEDLNVDEVCSLLESKGFEPDLVRVFRKQKVSGCILVDLDDAEMEDLGIEAWGDRRRLRKLISSGVAKQSPTVTPRRYEVVGYAKQANPFTVQRILIVLLLVCGFTCSQQSKGSLMAIALM